MDVIVVSIGTLSKNPLWNEKQPVRTSHATTTLIRAGKQNILVDPSLPPQILEPRLFERTGLLPAAITRVFLTSWRPVHRRGLALFEKAAWYLHEREIEAALGVLEDLVERANRTDPTSADASVAKMVKDERELLKRAQAAPNHLAEGVDLFPLPGYTPGQSGLLIANPTSTILIAGDAVPTASHFAAGQVFPDAFDLEQAKTSMFEMYEVADFVIPGHDNLFANPRVAGM